MYYLCSGFQKNALKFINLIPLVAWRRSYKSGCKRSLQTEEWEHGENSYE